MKYQRTNCKLALACPDPLWAVPSAHLAEQLKLPLARPDQTYELLLQYSSEGLELHRCGMILRVDLSSGSLAFRQRQQGKDLLLRAVVGKKKGALQVVDATGGLGRDAFLLAAAGHQVQVCEQQVVLAALLADGLKRASLHPNTAAAAARIQLTVGNASHLLQTLAAEDRRPEVMYLDPMFPQRQKSALVKKEAQFLQELVPETPNEDILLLQQARDLALYRTVVKRPVHAAFLGESEPSFSLSGKTIRFDIYLRG